MIYTGPFNTRAIVIGTEPGDGFIRIFGWGISWTDTRRHRLWFSQRNRLMPSFYIGPWYIEFLGRWKR